MVNVSSDVRDITQLDRYDQNKFKLHSSIRWLFSFIPSYHKDKVKNNVRNNLDFLQLPPKTIAGSAIWRDVIALLVSCEAYRCASLAIFGAPAPQNHWQVIQKLARHGFYVVTEDGTGVIQTALLTANPFNQASHIAMIDCLMQAYSCRLVTIPRAVAVVKKIGAFNASQELPYDLEDSLVLWINKICQKVKKGLNEAVTIKKQNLKQGLVHPSATLLPPHIPFIEDLVQDIGDGQCLGVLTHHYLPNDLPLEALKFGSTLPQCDKASNLGAVRFAIVTELGASWFPLSVETFLNPSFVTKTNVIVFISELFWKWEVKGTSRNEFSSECWLKEDERSGEPDMNCAAAATEISQQLEKCPVSLEPITGRLDSSSESSADELDEPLLPIIETVPDLPEKLVPELGQREIIKYTELPNVEEEGEEEDSAISSQDETDLRPNKYFDPADSSALIQSTVTGFTKSSQSLGSLDQMIAEAKEELKSGDESVIVNGYIGTGPTPQSLRRLHKATESVDSTSESESSSDEEEQDAKLVPTAPEPQPADEPPVPSKATQPDPLAGAGLVSKSLPSRPGEVKRTHVRRKSGEEIVAEMKMAAEEKREFYVNIARWVDTVEKECKPKPISASELTTNISKTIETHFSKPPAVGASFTILKEDKSEALRRGIPVIENIPVTPAPAPPLKIKGDYLMTVKERDDAIKKQQDEEARKKREELDKKRQLEEKLAEEKRQIEEMSDSSNKSSGSKKGKKGGKGAAGKKGGKGGKDTAKKEGKSFPRRPGSVTSNSSAASSAKGGKGAKGKKGKTKDDMSVKSEKITRSKSGKKEPAANKRRVKSARRAGKSVSFVDEKSESDAPEVPAIELVPKEQIAARVECPFKKDTQVIGEDKVDRKKLSYFVPLEDAGVGQGSGPIEKRPLSGSGWPGDHESAEDSLLAVRNTDSEESLSSSSGEESESESEGEQTSPELEPKQRVDFNHILNSLQPQYGSEPVFVFERRDSCKTPQTPIPSDPKQLVIHLQMQEKRKNIEKIRSGLQNKWEEERAQLNRHVFYEALKKTRDIGEQANSEDIRAELERSDSLEQLVPHLGSRTQKDPFNAKPGHPKGAAPTSVKPRSLLERAINDTEEIFSPVVDDGYDIIAQEKTTTEQPQSKPPSSPSIPDPLHSTTKTLLQDNVMMKKKSEPEPSLEESSSDLVAVFSNHEDFLSTKISVSDAQSSSTSMSRKPTAMQYFYGFSDVVSENKVSQKRQQFFVAQKKKQEELKARRDLELQRKLEKDRHQSHIEGEYRRHEGNLVTKCPRAKSSRVRVVRTEEKLLPAQRPASAAPGRTMMTCRTPEQSAPRGTSCRDDMRGNREGTRDEMRGNREGTRGHMYPDKNRLMETGGGATYRKHTSESSPDGRSNTRNRHLRDKMNNTPRNSPQNNTRHTPKNTPRPPALPLFVPPSAKSNSKVISNAVCWTCLSGVPDKPQQQQAVKAIANHPAQQYVILFRDHIAKKFRGIYTYDTESAKLIKIYGKGPKTIIQQMLSYLYKYDSGSRSFSDLPTLSFSLSVDGITIRNELWRKAGVYPC